MQKRKDYFIFEIIVYKRFAWKPQFLQKKSKKVFFFLFWIWASHICESIYLLKCLKSWVLLSFRTKKIISHTSNFFTLTHTCPSGSYWPTNFYIALFKHTFVTIWVHTFVSIDKQPALNYTNYWRNKNFGQILWDLKINKFITKCMYEKYTKNQHVWLKCSIKNIFLGKRYQICKEITYINTFLCM